MDTKAHRNQLNFTVKILDLSLRLLKEHNDLRWIPCWLLETPGIGGAALGFADKLSCKVEFAWQNAGNETGSTDIEAECIRFDDKGQPDLPHTLSDLCDCACCPVKEKVLGLFRRGGEPITCFPLPGKKAFLMAYGPGLQDKFSPTMEIINAVVLAISRAPGLVGTTSDSPVVPSEDLAQMWAEMLAGLSHDLRTPLACIKGYATTILRDDVSWDVSTQKEFLNIIVEETDYIEKLINRLLDSSTLSWNAGIELEKEPVSLPHIVNKVIREPSYCVKHHVFDVLFPGEFPLVDADPVRIEQVLRNLVENAVKYSEEKTLIAIQGEVASGEVVVSVADQGIGIGDEHMNRLFDKFFRIKQATREQQKGMGLGLPLARHIVVSHGGRIWSKSRLNQGTTFYFSLPCGSA